MASVRARPTGMPRDSATSAARRQARTHTSEPTSTDATWAAAKVGPKIAIGMAIRNVGSGSQTSKAGRGNDSGGVWKLQIASVVRPWPSSRLRATPT